MVLGALAFGVAFDFAFGAGAGGGTGSGSLAGALGLFVDPFGLPRGFLGSGVGSSTTSCAGGSGGGSRIEELAASSSSSPGGAVEGSVAMGSKMTSDIILLIKTLFSCRLGLICEQQFDTNMSTV